MAPANWFIALPFPGGNLPAGEMDALPPHTRRFLPDDLHVTVAFLGAVDRATAVRAWSDADWSGESPLCVKTGRRATFGSPRRPSAYGLEFDDPRSELQAFIARWRDRLLAAADRPPEKRAVRPHVTLGRPARRGGDTIRVREWLATRPDAMSVTLDRVALYTRSKPGSERRFETVDTRNLSAHATNSGGQQE